MTAYWWGFKQPADLKPPCDPRFNHLNGVTIETKFSYFFLSVVTLGIISKRHVTWCCAPYYHQSIRWLTARQRLLDAPTWAVFTNPFMERCGLDKTSTVHPALRPRP